MAVIDRILHEVPPPPSRLDASIPDAFDAVVARALEKDQARRYQSARELREDLHEVARGLTTGQPGTARMAAPRANGLCCSVAVMTFANITREPADDWIGTGIAETVSTDLKNIAGLSVICRARVFDALRNISSSGRMDEGLAIDIGRRLGAAWVVVGGFQRLGELIRITANFIDVSSGEAKRTVKVDGRLTDIFSLQDKIVFDLSQGLNLALRGSEIAQIERRETRSVEAYESYARGMMNLRLATRDSMERAIAAFEAATAQDPEYALAWAALGGAYALKGSFMAMPDLARRAIDMERRALALDPGLPEAHVWLGSALLGLRRTDEAIAAVQQAIRLDPDNGQAHQGLARAYWVGKGDFAAAIPAFERSIELNPEAGYSYLQLGLLLAWEGQYDRAEAVCRTAVGLQEQYISGNAGLQIVGAHARLGYVHYLRGDYDAALREYERELMFIGSSDHALRDRTAIELNIKIGAAHLRKSQPEDARRFFGRALKAFETRVSEGADDPSTRYYAACAYALLGDADRALDSLERVASSLPALTAARIRRDPDLDSLRGHERFQALLGNPQPGSER